MSLAKLINYVKTLFVSKDISPSEFLIENKLLMKRRTMIKIGVSAKNLRLRDLVPYQYDEESDRLRYTMSHRDMAGKGNTR